MNRASIRVRVLAAMVAVLVLTITAVLFTASRLQAQALERPISDGLDARAAATQRTARQSDSAETLKARMGLQQIKLSITTRDGRHLLEPLPDDLNSHDYRYRIVQLDGPGELSSATATLWIDASGIRAGVAQVQRDLIMIGLVALLCAIVVTVVVTDVALRPLDAMAERARRISNGERGLRMGPAVGSPEIGKAAKAIDDMLDELERSEAKAMASEMSAVEAHTRMRSFLADAAHELKTPLAGIQAAAEALMHMPEDAPPEERDDLEFLLAREANRGGHLVSSLLEAAHVDSGVFLRTAPVDVMPLLLAEQQRLSLSRPGLDFQIIGPALTVRADKNGYTSVLRNLVENAATAAGSNGWIRVVCRQVLAEDGQTPMVQVEVIDSGPGVPQADRERVFDRLVRLASTASSTKGSGLGLAIARGYARAMNGDVRYATEPSVEGLPGEPGAVFVASVPLAEEAEDSPELPAEDRYASRPVS